MKEALKLALEALNTPRPSDSYPPLWRAYEKTINEAITAIKEALAQPEQKPVGVFREDDDIGHVVLVPHQQAALKDGDKLYTTSPQEQRSCDMHKPLTDEQINQIADEFIVDYRIPAGSQYDFVRAIEAAHGIKE